MQPTMQSSGDEVSSRLDTAVCRSLPRRSVAKRARALSRHSGMHALMTTLFAEAPLPLTFTGLQTCPFGHCELY